MSGKLTVQLVKPYAAWGAETKVEFSAQKAQRLVREGYGCIVEEKPKAKKRKGAKK